MRRVRIVLLTLIPLLLAGMLVYALRYQILTGLGKFLIVDDSLQPADIIFILNGDLTNRPFHAAKLFKQQLAPQIVIAREEDSPASELGLYPNGTDVAVSILAHLGIPVENITIITITGGATSTRDEALALRNYIERHHLQRVIVVTSAFHTRRAGWIFDRVLAGSGATLEISAAPQWKFDETNWWQYERGLITLANEYIKLVYYFVVY